MTLRKSIQAMQDLDKRIDLYVKAVSGKKASDIKVLDLRGLSSVADIFIICSALSNRQAIAISDFVERYLKSFGIKPLSIEGRNEGLWVLLDYGEVVIHVFYETVRKFYDLEGLWSDAKGMTTESMMEKGKKVGALEVYVE